MVQVWKGENGPVVQNQLEQILTGGYAALLSAGYYLDVQIPNVNQTWYLALGKTLNLNLARSAPNGDPSDVWKNFYLNEPLSDELLNKLSPEQLSQFKGAEVWYVVHRPLKKMIVGTDLDPQPMGRTS
jgi:hypothetical protein